MDCDLKRRQVTEEQLNSLLEFMKEHPELARGLSRGRRGKLTTFRVWHTCADQLNRMKDGAVKDGKGWSKYWCDWKYRVRRHALEIKVARDTDKVPPEGITPLSAIEETIMAIIGDSSIDGVVVKSDPLEDEDPNEDKQETNDSVATNSKVYETKRRVVKRRRVSAVCTSNEIDDDDDSKNAPQRPRFEHKQESDSEDDNTTQFLRLEKMQLENAKKIQKSICKISLEICKLTDIMGEIRDVLVKRLDHVT